MADCLFCAINRERVIAFNALAYAIRDAFPVTEGHTLIIPKRHVEDYFGMTEEEVLACDELLRNAKEELEIQYPDITGFNIGSNAGQAAGQTIFHCHMHLIPRRDGDVKNPRGGVRQLIPGKGSY